MLLILLFPRFQHFFASVILWTSSSCLEDLCSFLFLIVDFTDISLDFSFFPSVLTSFFFLIISLDLPVSHFPCQFRILGLYGKFCTLMDVSIFKLL